MTTDTRGRLVVLISGSRRLRTDAHRDAISAFIEGALYGLKEECGHWPTHAIVLHGAQKGADTIAGQLAREFEVDSWGVPYFAELDKPAHGLYPGGPKRNECIIDIACVLRETSLYRVVMGAFPDPKSTGTHRAIRYALRRGIFAQTFMQE